MRLGSCDVAVARQLAVAVGRGVGPVLAVAVAVGPAPSADAGTGEARVARPRQLLPGPGPALAAAPLRAHTGLRACRGQRAAGEATPGRAAHPALVVAGDDHVRAGAALVRGVRARDGSNRPGVIDRRSVG